MHFASKQDIEAPIAAVFQILTDFEAWERAVMRRGIEVERKDKLRLDGPGMRWGARFDYRGKTRDLDVELTQLENPALVRFAGVSQALEGLVSVELLELGANRTRMHTSVEITPRSLTARLFLQSLRLARAKLDRKFDQRVAQMAGDIELRYRALRRA
ncbi:MAG: SRPBCC family protein [Cypionkella sp.]|jgi:carbon monoxide dehydrogenase subunit G